MSRVPKSVPLDKLDAAIKTGAKSVQEAKKWGCGANVPRNVMEVLVKAAGAERRTIIGHSCPGEVRPNKVDYLLGRLL